MNGNWATTLAEEMIKVYVLELVTSVLNGEEESVDLPMLPISHFTNYVKELDLKNDALTGDDTNGWSIDFWYGYTHREKGKFKLSGSLHYGEFKFYKDDEEDGDSEEDYEEHDDSYYD